MNTFGETLRLTTFGESHGPAIGGVLDGMPPGVSIDYPLLRTMMAERRPGSSRYTSQRREEDLPELLSGISEDGLTLGTPIGFIIRNRDARSSDYGRLRDVYRPNHADYTYQAKYGLRDHRGGGRASARETAVRVAAAALVRPLLDARGITVAAKLTAIGEETDPQRFEQILGDVTSRGDSIGGVVECYIKGMPTGLGEPLFGKLQARLGGAMMSIPGVKGFEYGDGFAAALRLGSEQIDRFTTDADGRIVTVSNHSGGIQGGISNGMEINMRIAFKPTPTISLPVETVDSSGRPVTITVEGRHDPCIAVRGVAVVKAMVILTIADALLTSSK